MHMCAKERSISEIEDINSLFFDCIFIQRRDLLTCRLLRLPQEPDLHDNHRQLLPNIPYGENILRFSFFWTTNGFINAHWPKNVNKYISDVHSSRVRVPPAHQHHTDKNGSGANCKQSRLCYWTYQYQHNIFMAFCSQVLQALVWYLSNVYNTSPKSRGATALGIGTRYSIFAN